MILGHKNHTMIFFKSKKYVSSFDNFTRVKDTFNTAEHYAKHPEIKFLGPWELVKWLD